MDMSLQKLQKRIGSGPLAVLVGLSVLGFCSLASLVLADVSSATVPPAGLNCKEADGKIGGRGSTYQNNLQEETAKLYRDDFCGNAGTETAEDKVGGKERGEAGNTMVAYNYVAAESLGATGSGAGLRAASCRTDAFAGTDLPYSEKQLKELDGAPGVLTENEGKACSGSGLAEGKFLPPFQPDSPAEWPGKEDTAGTVMSFPVGGSSVTLPVNLTAGNCGGTAPTSLNFTPKEVSRIFGGAVATWNDAELVATNASLSKCTEKLVRVVRFDNSGTTNIFKSYLVRADNERTGQECAKGKNWSTSASTVSGTGEYFESPNIKWPGKQAEEKKEKGAEGTCSEIITAGTSGGGALVKKVTETPDGIGYADLADAAGKGLLLPNVQNATGTAFVAPNTAKQANCTYNVVSLPGVSSSDSVGLNAEDNWGNNNESSGNPNHENATDLGIKYPICGLTFDLVYKGLDAVGGVEEEGKKVNPESRLTADQRRTLYSYMTFLLSSAAQDNYGKINYAPLPSSWLPVLREGFQNGF
jgi:ABC-type phosphate transport system substrate-binding protein